MLIAIYPIFGLSRPVDPVFTVRLLLHQPGGKLFGEENLTYMRGVVGCVRLTLAVPAGPNLEVDVVGAAHVEPGEDRLEDNQPLRIGKLDSTKKRKFVRRVILRRRAHSLPALGRRARRKTRRRTSRTPWAARTPRIHLRKSRVESERIAMPDIYGHVGERFASTGVHNC